MTIIGDEPQFCLTCKIQTRKPRCPHCEDDDNLYTRSGLVRSIAKWQRYTFVGAEAKATELQAKLRELDAIRGTAEPA